MEDLATVYILEPDNTARQALPEAVAAAGVEAKAVTVFRNPGSLLEAVEDTPPMCVISALHLPQMTGLELQAVLLREQPASAVVLTAECCEAEAVVQAMKQGAVDFLQKPIRPVELLRALNEALTLARAWRQVQAERQRTLARLNTLVERERQVLPLLARGLSNKQVASELSLGLRSVEHYRRSTLEKMQAESLLELARQWMLTSAHSPRCLELFRPYMDPRRNLPHCSHEGCTAVGSVTRSPDTIVSLCQMP